MAYLLLSLLELPELLQGGVMSERNFRFIVSLVLLAALYFDLRAIVLGMAVLYAFEGLTNWRVPILVSRWRGQAMDTTCDPGAVAVGRGLSLEAEQVLRIVIAIVLFVSAAIYAEAAWFVPWLIGFALLGAAITGVCPCILGLKLCGFK